MTILGTKTLLSSSSDHLGVVPETKALKDVLSIKKAQSAVSRFRQQDVQARSSWHECGIPIFSFHVKPNGTEVSLPRSLSVNSFLNPLVKSFQ